MDDALEEIEFLARSANRVRVLDRLAEGGATRRELESATDASQPTLGRVLRDLQDRRWVDHDGIRYEATATGRLVSEAFSALAETVRCELTLRPVIEWLPAEELGFDLARLADATITTPSQTRPGAPVRRLVDLLRGASEVRIFSHALNEQSLDVIRRRTSEGSQSFEGVVSADAISAMATDDELRGKLARLVAADDAAIRRADEAIPLAVTIADDVVHLLIRDDEGLLRASIDTDDEAVRSWARERYDQYRDRSTPLDPEAFS
jgi:predicted transcriptional regulator